MAGTDLWAVIVGGAIGIAGSFVPHLWAQSRARASARAAARAYVSGILEMEKIHQQGSVYQGALSALKSGSAKSLPVIFGAEEYPNDEMQKSLLNQIGLLDPDAASDIVLFGNMLNGLRVDLKAIALGQLNDLSLSEKIRIIEGDLKIWGDTQELGRKIVARLSAPSGISSQWAKCVRWLRTKAAPGSRAGGAGPGPSRTA